MKTQNQTAEEQFKEKYEQVLSEISRLTPYSHENDFVINNKRIEKEAYQKYGPQIYRKISEIVKPTELKGSKVTLLYSIDESIWKLGEPIRCTEQVLKAAGVNYEKLIPDFDIYKYRFSDMDSRCKKFESEKFRGINESDYVVGVLEHVCDSSFFPILRNASKQGKKTIIFMDSENLNGICSGDEELQELKELKREAKDIHLIAKLGNFGPMVDCL